MPLETVDDALAISSTTIHQVSVSAALPPYLRRSQAEKAQLGQAAMQAPVELAGLINIPRSRGDLIVSHSSSDISYGCLFG